MFSYRRFESIFEFRSSILSALLKSESTKELYVSSEGKNIEAGFNPKYFLDAFRAIDDEEVFIDFGTSISPCIIRPVDDGDYIYMILPIRMKE